jgi:GNAT superfamily N-acetyltransferase
MFLPNLACDEPSYNMKWVGLQVISIGISIFRPTLKAMFMPCSDHRIGFSSSPSDLPRITPMPIKIEPLDDATKKAELCGRLSAELPMWFGRPESNVAYMRGIATRNCYVAEQDKTIAGLIALDYHFGTTCNVWWLGVRPSFHRRGIGRALVERALQEAQGRGCRYLAVETMSPRAKSQEYDLTGRFYLALGFEPLIEFEPEPADFMMWMVRRL